MGRIRAHAENTFDKVLVANRGEIAIRISRTLRELGLGAVAVYSEADRAALHVALRRRGVPDRAGAGGRELSEDRDARRDRAARRARARCIPGYGFLAENASFARAVEEAGLVWIGPPPEAIELMGSKTRARQAMQAAGVPIIPGTTDPVGSVEELLALGDEIGYPLLIKAAAGGGGKGMEVVHVAGRRRARVRDRAPRRGSRTSPNPDVYVEKLIVDPRHVEVQVLADAHGNVIHLGERDCTIQRRHQKLDRGDAVTRGRRRSCARGSAQIGVDAARACGYRSAGTIEGLLTQDGEYFFMEMNTRIQVEHTVTEEVTGLDLVREQVRIALGEPLSLTQEQVELRGHAIECRINAEDVVARASCRRPGSSPRTTSRRAPACASTRASPPATRSRARTTR